MGRIQLTELSAFVAVAEHRSFTKAAAMVGIAPATMSQTIRSLEDGLGVRLFNRTTRSVALTEAGDRLLAEVLPILDSIDHAVDSINSFRDKPIGTLRLVASRPFSSRLLEPIIAPFLAEYPAIRAEIAIDNTNSDIVRGRFDAGIRLGHRVERDMTILRISDDLKLLAVAAPAYLQTHAAPVHPRDVHSHNCVRYRSPFDQTVQTWLFAKDGEQIETSVEGSLTVNDVELMQSAVLNGVGLGYLPEQMAAPYLAQGRLVQVLEDWSGSIPGVFLYHPSRRQKPMPLQVFLRFVETRRKLSPQGAAT